MGFEPFRLFFVGSLVLDLCFVCFLSIFMKKQDNVEIYGGLLCVVGAV